MTNQDETELMATPRVCVLRAPGTNCDIETAHAFELCGAQADRIHLFRALEKPDLLRDYQILCVPGGFSFGDDIGAGVIFSRQLRGEMNSALGEFLTSDKLALGICNGFQVLLKAGLITPPVSTAADANPYETGTTLTWNDNGKYTALWVKLKVCSKNSVFLRDIDEIEMPIAHAEGRLVVKSPELLQQWQSQQQIALCYASTNGIATPDNPIQGDVLPYPDNPNGSVANIAGLSDATGRVLGLMPHPERFIHATQHPQWTRRELRGEGAGLQIFKNAVNYFA